MIILLASGLVFAALALYWFRMGVWRSSNYGVWQLPLLPLILLALVWLQQTDGGFQGSASPIFVAIVADVSLSMGTMPEPREHGEIGTRLQRARRALLPLLTQLEASPRPVMIGLTAFTSSAETIIAWDDNLPQIREAVEYVLTPGLLTESGSDLGAALEGAERLFEILPVDYRGPDTGKFIILVSDGEQNVEASDTATGITKLRESGVKIISLHVGLAETPEGLPVYDGDGMFVGFDEVGGQLFSVPNPELMRMIAGPTPEQGMFVKAERNGAAERMMEYIGVHTGGTQAGSLHIVLIVILWLLTTAVVLRYV